MEKYIFILGKNQELSLAELESYFETNEYENEIIEKTDNFVVFGINKPLDEIIHHLGGTIKIARVEKIISNNQNIEDYLNDLIPNKNESKYFGLSLYPIGKPRASDFKLSRKLLMFVKKRTKLKFLPFPKTRRIPELTHVEVIKKRLIEDSFEVVVAIGEKKYLGKTIQVHNPFEFKKRDVDRPVQRPIFSIPPRLAKIMINLSRCKPKQKLLDPFCGIGTIIQESLLEGVDTIGVDIDESVIRDAINNIEWLNREYDLKLDKIDKMVVHGDAKKLSENFPKNSFDAIVTEPYLGPPLPRYIDRQEANQTIGELKPLFQTAFQEFSRIIKSNGRLVIVIPSIRVDDGIVKMDTNFIQDCGLFVEKKIMDFEDRHRILREIYVIKKN